MIGLLLVVIGLTLVGKLIDYIGKDAIGEFVWEIFTQVSPSPGAKALREEQRRAIDLYTQRANTSSKDEFAKWAKLDREYGKSKSKIDELNQQINGSKGQLKKLLKVAIFMLTSGSKWWLRFRHRKVAIFYLPEGVVPRPIQWVLSFSSAPMGSVSVSMWITIVNSAVSSLIDTAIQLVAYQKQSPVGKATKVTEPKIVELDEKQPKPVKAEL